MKWQHRQCGMLTGSSSCCPTTQQATSSNLMLPCTVLALSVTSLAGARPHSLYICAHQYILCVAYTHNPVIDLLCTVHSQQSGVSANRQHVL